MRNSTYDTATTFRDLPPVNPFVREARFFAQLVAEPSQRPICAIQNICFVSGHGLSRAVKAGRMGGFSP